MGSKSSIVRLNSFITVINTFSTSKLLFCDLFLIRFTLASRSFIILSNSSISDFSGVFVSMSSSCLDPRATFQVKIIKSNSGGINLFLPIKKPSFFMAISGIYLCKVNVISSV